MEKKFEKNYQARIKEGELNREIVAVFSSVSPEAPSSFKNMCSELGYALAKNNFKMSYGGSRTGCSKWLVDGAEKAGSGDIRAVKYSDWPVNERMADPPKGMRTEIVQTAGPDLFMRIAELKRNALACIVLPGGPATLEELWNSIVGVAELGALPIILLNIDNFFEPTKEQMKKMADYFYWPKYNNYVIYVSTVEEAIQQLNTLRYMKYIKNRDKPYNVNIKRSLRQKRSKQKTNSKKSITRKIKNKIKK